jgi:hypothetical protein
MCHVKWQQQYNLVENSTPVSIRALLFVLESIKSNAELDHKPPSNDKAKGLTPKGKWILLMHVSPRRPRKAGQRSTFLSARNMGVHIPYTTPMSAGITTKMEATRRQRGCLHPTREHVRRVE